MAVYTVLEGHDKLRNLQLRDWLMFQNDSCGGRIYAESINWPFSYQGGGIQEGCIGMLDLETNPEQNTLMVTGLLFCSAVLYIYMNDDRVSAVVAFHSPSGTLNIKSGERKGDKFRGPIEEAKLLGHSINSDRVHVIIGAGPNTMSAYSKPAGVSPNYCKMAKKEHEQILNILKEEKIRKNQVHIYCSSTGSFGISELGYIGEPRNPPREYVPPPKKKRCYLATATCISLGRPDDCEELNLLRWYRDDVLLKTPDGRQDVELYYKTAPAIVDKINSCPNPDLIYHEIYFEYLAQAISAIRRADYQQAYRIYRELVFSMTRRFM